MKRSALRRSAGLSADPEKVREFERRGRESSARVFRAGAQAPARAQRARGEEEGPLSPADWRVAAFVASGGRCIVTGARADDAADRRFHAHHAVPKGTLRDRGLRAFVWDPRNAAWCSRQVHLDHEFAPGKRIVRELLPASVWEFCAELDALDGSQWATALVERLHPAAG